MKSQSINQALGVDISKDTFDVALNYQEKVRFSKFTNDKNGFKNLLKWLNNYNIASLHVCLESTGIYGFTLAEFLYNKNFIVSIVNPAKIKGFAQSVLSRTKTDKNDALLISKFCLTMSPSAWKPQTKKTIELQALNRRIRELKSYIQQEKNGLESASKSLHRQIKAHINYLKKYLNKTEDKATKLIEEDSKLSEKKELLRSIPGVGKNTINVVLANFPEINKFNSATKLASFIGIAPREKQSGSSVKGRGHISKGAS